MPTSCDPTADLSAATSALLAALVPHYGPCEHFTDLTDGGKVYLSFHTVSRGITDGVHLLTVDPEGDEHVVIDHRNGDAELARGATPSEAMGRAVEILGRLKAA
jgi:hypothetical protein